MKNYTVEWWSNRIEASHKIEASSENEAYKIAIDKFTYEEYPRILISTGWGLSPVNFENPHHPLNKSRPEQPARPDGSVGWSENLGESSLSDRGILLAQLHELRTIKRCVVCTILIVIVIPIVFGITR